MEKINFINNSQPAINATNLNKMQDNVEDAISEKIKTTETTSDTDTYSCNYINDIDNRFNYSTNEQIIGVWMNKPLYRKTIIFTDGISANTTFTKNHNINNVDEIWVDLTHTFWINISGKSYPIIMTNYDAYTNTDTSTPFVDKTQIGIVSKGGWGTNWTKYFTVEYTKTTD